MNIPFTYVFYLLKLLKIVQNFHFINININIFNVYKIIKINLNLYKAHRH